MSAQKEIHRLVFHHSAAWDYDGGDAAPTRLPTYNEIKRKHLDNGWSDIGYHIVVDRDGTRISGRSVGIWPAAHKPKNANSYAVCAIGWNGPTSPDPSWAWTVAQIARVREIAAAARLLFHGYSGLIVQGHRDVWGTATECPGLDIQEIVGR